MQIPALPIEQIPPLRKARSDTELHHFIAKDLDTFERMKTQWVRQTARAGLDGILRAGNPPKFISQIDGSTRSGGKTKEGAGFRAGTIDQATTAVRIEWIGADLAKIANRARPILLKVIGETFPKSRTRQLRRQWSWYRQRDATLPGKRATPATKLFDRVPDNIGLNDILWLAPDASVADHAWIANKGISSGGAGGHKYNLRVRNSKKFGAKSGFTLRKKLRGYLAESTSRMRKGGSNVSAYRSGGVVIQGWFVKKKLTGPMARTKYGVDWKRGVPVVRLAYRKGLLTQFIP